jgi:hypothetical protein
MTTFGWVAIGVGILVGGAVIIALATPAPGVAVPSNQIVRQQVTPVPGLTVSALGQQQWNALLGGLPKYTNPNA